MAKRGLHFKAPGTAKRQRHTPPSTPPLTLEGSLSEELLLRCLSFLDAPDLTTLSRLSSAWHRLAQDGQLWRPLYLSAFASAAQRSAALYGSGTTPPRLRPWKELYKISANWRRGSATSSSLIGSAVRRAVLPEAPPDDAASVADDDPGPSTATPTRAARARPGARSGPRVEEQSDLLLQFKGSYFLTASRRAVRREGDETKVPEVTVLKTLPGGGSVTIGSVRSTALDEWWRGREAPAAGLAITELRLDESVSHARDEPKADDAAPTPTTIRLVVFLSTGQWSIFLLSLPTPNEAFSATEIHCTLALSTPQLPFGALRPPPSIPHAPPPPAFDPVTIARLHGPLLVTCSEGFVIRFWSVEGENSSGGVSVMEVGPAMQTHECHLPVVLGLHPVPAAVAADDEGDRKEPALGPRVFRASVAYATPVYPAAWTVALQEFDVHLPRPAGSSPQKPAAQPEPAPRRARIAPRHVAARAPPGVDHSLITAVEFAAPFLVASRNNNTIDVFELVREGGADRVEVKGSGMGTEGRATDVGAGRSGRRFVRRSSSSLLGPSTASVPMSSRPREPLVTPATSTPHARPHHAPPSPPPRPRHLAPLPRRAAPSPTPPLQLVHRRTLFGHTGSVRSVALLGGKCVSGGADGQVKVWDLDGLKGRGRRGGEGVVTVTQSGLEGEGEGEGLSIRGEMAVGGWEFAKGLALGGGEGRGRPGRVERVWFDEEQIVSIVEGEGVRLLRFD